MILEKPTVEMTRHIRPFYVSAHFNGKLVSKVLMDNGLVVNVMPLRMLRALGRGVDDLIETAKLLKTTTIVPFTPIKGLIIEEIDD